jgi:hypothetical protein
LALIPLAVHCAILSGSYLPDNELEGKGAGESLVLCMEEMCGMVGSGSCVEEGQGDCGDNDAEFYGSILCI